MAGCWFSAGSHSSLLQCLALNETFYMKIIADNWLATVVTNGLKKKKNGGIAVTQPEKASKIEHFCAREKGPLNSTSHYLTEEKLLFQ